MAGSDLTPLAGLTALQMLSLRDTTILDLSPISGLTSLKGLGLALTGVTDLAPISGLTALETLSLWQARDSDRAMLTDLSPIAGLTHLKSLSLDNTPVADLRKPAAAQPHRDPGWQESYRARRDRRGDHGI